MLRSRRLTRPPILLDFLAPGLIRRSNFADFSKSSSSKAATATHRLEPSLWANSLQLPVEQSISNLRASLSNRDILKASHEWTYLEKQQSLSYITPAHLEYCFRKLCDTIPVSRSHNWGELECASAERIALAMAVNHSVRALQLCMALRIQRKQPDQVIRLYDEYSIACEILKNSQGRKTSQNSSFLVPLDEDVEDVGVSEHSPLLIAVVIAHILKETTMPDLLRVIDRTDIPRLHIASSNIEDFVQHLAHDPMLQSNARATFPKLRMAKLASHPEYLKTYTLDLARRATTRLDTLYRDFRHNVVEKEGCLASTRFAISKTRPVLVDERVWAVFLNAYLQCPHKSIEEKRQIGESIWNDMTANGGKPGTSMYSVLIQGYAHMLDETEAIRAWNAMISEGIRPDTSAYRAMIESLLKAKQYVNALIWLERFEKAAAKGAFGEDLHPILVVFNSAVHGLLDTDHLKEANNLLERMRIAGYHPDVATYNAFMHHHGKRGELKAVATLLQRLATENLQPDTYTFAIVLEALLKAGRMDAVDMIFQMMAKYKVKAGVVMYSSIVHHLIDQRHTSYMKAALDIICRMEGNPETIPTIHTYVGLLSGLYRGKWLDRTVAQEAENFIVGRMNARGIKMNAQGYNVLIKSCLFNPGPEGVKRLLEVYREAKVKRIKVDRRLLDKAVEKMVKAKQWAAAREMLGDIPPEMISESHSKLLKSLRIYNFE